MKIFRVDYSNLKIDSNNDYAIHIEGVRRFYDFCRSSDEPIVLVSSETVFRKKRWGKYKETATPNPNTNSGLLYLGLEAIANLFDNVKIVRGAEDIWIARYAPRFDKMPKILHVASQPTILNTNRAKKLGIL
jgi:dTDP-4-dehydrorhamnose reductase